MIRLADMNQDELEQFERRVKRGFYKSGVVIEYHVGNMGDQVAFTPLGKLMQGLAGYRRVKELVKDDEGKEYMGEVLRYFKDEDKVTLVQKKLSFERFQYLGYMK